MWFLLCFYFGFEFLSLRFFVFVLKDKICVVDKLGKLVGVFYFVLGIGGCGCMCLLVLWFCGILV